jgi:hypothetical protein
MLIHSNPGALVWPAAMFVWGPGFTSDHHRHHCVQLVMVVDGSLRIRSGSEDAWKSCGAALVRPDANHEVDARGRTLLIGFIDPESELGSALAQRTRGNISPIPIAQVKRWRSALGSRLTQLRVEHWVGKELLNRRQSMKIHPRVPAFSNIFATTLVRERTFR